MSHRIVAESHMEMTQMWQRAKAPDLLLDNQQPYSDIQKMWAFHTKNPDFTRVEAVLNSEGGKITMFNTDLATLMPDQWLNDKVIDGYLTITIKEAQAKKYHAMNCVTVGQIFQGIYRSLSVKHKNMMLSTHNRTLCPVNTGGCHWLLVVCNYYSFMSAN
ncbi:PREDICTED: uncharacterized protein LOC106811168 [Priapulus caudatus]|uniref:Uncharacterized protein LOC106811168 n=1 Tax=Priapulus caudatus TaxID=37621 RepID=A0ABM1EDC7_PRICU|nr:PREDICTED: uncharacterized protein LOC106811168 [Priapulus caudatus]